MDNSYTTALAKGCLGGLALAAAWALAGVALYGVGLLGGAERKIALVCGIAGGPTLISVAILIWFWRRGQQVSTQPDQNPVVPESYSEEQE